MRATAAVLSALVLAGGLLAVSPASAQDDTPTDPGDLRVEAGVAPGSGVPDPRPGEAFADPKVAELQHTATDVQRELSKLAGRIRNAKGKVAEAARELSEARTKREAAEREVEKQQAEVDQLSATAYKSMGRPNELSTLLTATDPDQFLQASTVVSYLREGQDKRLHGALKRLRKEQAAEREALGLERKASKRKSELTQRNSDATNRADAISSELRSPIDVANAAVTAQQLAQKKRNAKTAKAWKAYVKRLDAAGITPPRAGSLRVPSQLPGGLLPLLGANGKPQPGVAQAKVGKKRLLVLPKETIEAVSAAVDALGKPYVPRDHDEGPTSYSCDGLVRSVFGDAGLKQPNGARKQYSAGKPVAVKDIRPGDLVFAGPKKYGVQHVGIALDRKTMLAADGRLASVAVTDIPGPGTLLAATRPSLGTGTARKTPNRAQGELTWHCGGVELPAGLQIGGGAASPGASGAWGGYPNGLIPMSALCGVGIGQHALRCDAAQGFVQMSRAFARASGRGLCITDSYRTFNAQVDLYRRKPALAAVPGTSNHGWGLAIDMCGGVQSFGSAEYRWMAQNGPAFGWVNPHWARPGGGREEPWHWEYVGSA
jgi:cell wall-associated NlpC family hydrolase